MKIFLFTLFFFLLFGGCGEALYGKTPGSAGNLLKDSIPFPALLLSPENTDLPPKSALKNYLRNKAPKADAGKYKDQRDEDGNGKERVQLDGSKSKDQDGTIVSYRWTIEGSDRELATGEKPTVDLSVGSTSIVLTVTDNEGLTDSDKVVIRIKEGKRGEDDEDGDDDEDEDEGDDEEDNEDDEEEEPANTAPVADAGTDQQLYDLDKDGIETVKLDGSKSRDEEGNIETYSWSVNGTRIATGESPNVQLKVGTHVVQLLVTDKGGLTARDEVEITISAPANKPPQAQAGPDQEKTDSDRNGKESIKLDGSGSKDPDGTIEKYTWTVKGVEIATGVSPTIELAPGTTTVVLTVTDDGGLSAEDEVKILISEGEPEEEEPKEEEPAGGEEENKAPVANAGADQEVTDTDGDGQEAIQLNAAGSKDEDGSISSYSWSVEGSGTVLATGVSPTVELPIGTTTLVLTVTDNGGLKGTDVVQIIIKGSEEQGEGEEPAGEAGIAFLPNLFSPNGDQMNDLFTLEATHVAKVHWRIYNRQGRLVYETRDVEEAIKNGWDGNAFGEAQPAGSYVWILEGNYTDGSPILIDGEIKGNVTLIR